MPGCLRFFKADGLSAREAWHLVRRLMHEARTKEGISYDDFLTYSRLAQR
jgi:hypothetical protein